MMKDLILGALFLIVTIGLTAFWELSARVRPTRRALRYFDQVEWDESSPADMHTPPRA